MVKEGIKTWLRNFIFKVLDFEAKVLNFLLEVAQP